MTAFIGRREFITLLGGASVAWPVAAHAQQAERIRRIGVLVTEPWPEVEGLHDGLLELGYREGKNLLIEYRFAKGDAGRFPGLAASIPASSSRAPNPLTCRSCSRASLSSSST